MAWDRPAHTGDHRERKENQRHTRVNREREALEIELGFDPDDPSIFGEVVIDHEEDR